MTLKMHTPNLVDNNITKLAKLFPNCITETAKTDDSGNVMTDKNGKILYELGVDFEILKQELSHTVIDGSKERYRLDWVGKREAIVTANSPIAKTLRPCRSESVDFDTTQNLFIEGDNLEALKILQESYLGKIKMIYIDPPYNTGNDFIYNDDFAEDTQEFFERSGQVDEEGNRLIANTESNGRFHSDWLSMMYSRLKLARNLLADDGVIFISIDDNEQANLKKICDEVFGMGNFISSFIWEKRTNRENRKQVSYRHDNILCFCKDSNIFSLFQLPMTEKALANYKNPDDDIRGLWKSDPATAQAGHATQSQFYDLIAPNGKVHKLESGRCWLYTKEVMDKHIQDNKIWFGKDGNGVPRVKTYLNSKERGLTPETIMFSDVNKTNEIAKNELKNLFKGLSLFDTPKPYQLIKNLLLMSSQENDIILDFFAGSSTTAHAVMQLNAEDGGKRKFIMVQIPEATDEKSEAYKAGFANIADISKERIRRARAKIKADNQDKDLSHLDTGFRVLKIDTTNMRDVYYYPHEYTQEMLVDLIDNIKPDRTAEDLLFQFLLDIGVSLSLPIVSIEINNHPVYQVGNDENLIVASMDYIDTAMVNEIVKLKPHKFVTSERAIVNDSDKTNIKERFKQLSSQTEVWFI
ncbi:type III restriction-modification system methyltransferase [Moraxella macacae 0408225]|uniref:site-specific DNA-methyltransferase (adenine-specific) n=1 Tax=Moraxella macacae 0408225 TaxID=1230338 RepID=L2F906_9GAMM|nr:site-specific DNA-methyltransferase [Moraxella macacae]ELA09390.1 type III restriction-modification system methyltransferase [Moraxella macacae 0408225]